MGARFLSSSEYLDGKPYTPLVDQNEYRKAAGRRRPRL